MVNRDEMRELAASILDYAKRLCPDRVPQPSMETIDAWADVLGSVPVPSMIWPEAVRVWALELAGDRMVTPREMKRAALLVRDRWESDPVRGEQLRQHRERLREERDAQLAAGTFGELRGYRPREIERGSEVDVEGIVSRIKARLAGGLD